MRIKKFLTVGLSALIAATMAVGLVACDNTSDPTDSTSGTSSSGTTSSDSTSTTKETITVWCSETVNDEGYSVVEQMEEQLAEYAESYETSSGTTFPYTFNVVGTTESNAAANMITDAQAGADIFCFAQDQLSRLVEAGCISAVPSDYESYIEANNDEGSISAGSVSDTLYAYPLTADNGYFVYYDTSVISEDDLANQTDLIAACKTAGTNIGFQLSEDGDWYNAAYFFGAGAVSEWTFNDDGSVKEYKDTYNSEAGLGLIALQGMAELMNSGVWVNSSASDSMNPTGGTCSVLVSGTWVYSQVAGYLGDNLGCTKLWEYTVNGTDYQLGSFSGYKLMGVKPQTDATKLAICQSIAYYLTSETCQEERFEAFGWGPSNTTVQASEAVLANPALIALNEQNVYATPQGQYPDAWWTAAASLGSQIVELATTTPATTDLQSILDTYSETLNSIANPAFVGWIVVGDLSEDSWNILTEVEDYQLSYSENTYASKSESAPYTGIWTITITIADVTWDAGFRFCIYGNWTATDAAYSISYNTSGLGYSEVDATNTTVTYSEGSDNNILLAAGTYVVTLDTTGTTPVITIVAA